MSKHFMQFTLVALLIVGSAVIGQAQVLNTSPSTTPTHTYGPANGEVQTAGGATAAQGEVQQTGWGIPLPKITMPKITMPKITMPKFSAPKMDSFTAPIKSGFGKMSAGSKKAWEGAKEMLSFGKDKTATSTVNRAASQQPSIWEKLTTRRPAPKVPQTVGEFMSQPRLDP